MNNSDLRSAKDNIIGVMNFVARQFSSFSCSELMTETLGQLGLATKVSRVEIIQFVTDPKAFITPKYEWTDSEVADGKDSPFSLVTYGELTHFEWFERLSEDQHFFINSKNFTKLSQNFSRDGRLKSILLVPMFIEKQLWGCICLYSLISDRNWARRTELNGLRALAGMLSAAIEHKNEIEALRESESLFEFTSDMSEGILILDWDGRVLYANKALVEFSEVQSPYELIDVNVTAFLHPDTVRDSMSALFRVKDGSGRGSFHDHLFMSKNGRLKYLEGAGKLVKFKGKDACLVSLRDVTEKRMALKALEEKTAELARTNQALRESEEFLRASIDNMQDAILLLDRDGTILFGNNAAASLVEIPSPGDGIGRNIAEFLKPELIGQAASNLELVFEGKIEFPYEYEIVTAKGNKRHIESTGRRITFQGKEVDIETIRDITERKKAEEAVRQSSAQLAAANELMRAEIAERQKS